VRVCHPIRARKPRGAIGTGFAANTPPGGAIGEAVARLFGGDARSEMDDDLQRMKALIETGRFPHDAAQQVGDAEARTLT
jgi:hypothetical protein